MKKLRSAILPVVKTGCVLLVFLMLAAPHAWAKPKKTMVKVMTRNLYLGADIFKVVEAAQTDPLTVPYAVAGVFNTMLTTNFWERAEAIADEIAETEPHVVGLQEVSTFYIQTPGDFMAGNQVQASEVVIDFYEVLNAALLARGLRYKAYTVTNADVELPMADLDAGPPYFLSDVRMVDHDVLLVRKGLPSQKILAENYQANLSIDIGGSPVVFKRGYVMADVKIKGGWYRVVNTHLEVRSAPGSVFRVFQNWQMAELVGTIAFVTAQNPRPLIVVGDFNSSFDDEEGTSDVPGLGTVPYVPPYQQAINAEYLDTWILQAKYGDGFTSGFDEYVSDPTAELDTRIDHVFVGMVAPKKIDKVISRVVGDEVADMTPSGLWPSDHAGVVAKIRFLNR